MRVRSRARAIALQALYCIALNPDMAEQIDNFAWLDDEVPDSPTVPVRQFALLIVQGVRAHIVMVDATIRAHIQHWDFDRLLEVDKAILRMSIYALIHLTDIPSVVTINEAVDLARHYSDEHSPAFVNGILDSVAKELPAALR